ncbi:integrase catalytic domain-containing protein [Trichonephila inaurata madagascariensis]|uniref:Integrase catalytic domain-containing protein n=1 Tax=Trichonephila inaurata madagascariensis TaxID=2747483 RepID=A0A8X7CC60_9ARAC|nr:integrase catalytic domain-containing protein [Trichonephila inaurata madagascariensis]
MAEAQSFELLKKKRKSLRTAVTKVVNELVAELSNFDLNVDRLSELVETLSVKFKPLTVVDQQLEPLFKPEEFDGSYIVGKLFTGERNRIERSHKKKNPFLSSLNFRPDWIRMSYHPPPKLLIQECWKIEASWDSKLPIDIERKFEMWKKQLIEVQDLKYPRRLSNLDLKDTNLSLQIFCDASKLSDATCVFLQAEREGEVTCQLIQAPSKVTPLKGISLTRLELLASMIGARIADPIKKDLHMENVNGTYWSDSMDALHWIKRESSWDTFVANRVEEIRLSCKENWRFVPGIQNSADLPSKGCSVKTLKKLRWCEGPSWRRNPTEDWPKSELYPDMERINSEKKTIITAAATQREEKYLRYSSYVKLVRIAT